jgi:3-deoxy-manno-octulosonate cytidylyltransferase (CMP-KDO synthetase)
MNGAAHTAVAVIPARYGSTRLPGKALLDIGGCTLIRRVYERVLSASRVSRVIVATDDLRIVDEVSSFGGEAVMTSPLHRSGTDRVAEAAGTLESDIVLNVQGDEPLIEPEVIDRVIARIAEDSGISCATAATPIRDESVWRDPNAVKVVVDLNGRAICFSRSPLPYWRDRGFGGALLHIGLYCFRREFLLRYAALEPTPLERAEKLEQLRMLEHGYHIGVVEVEHSCIGVDTEADLEAVRLICRERGI